MTTPNVITPTIVETTTIVETPTIAATSADSTLFNKYLAPSSVENIVCKFFSKKIITDKLINRIENKDIRKITEFSAKFFNKIDSTISTIATTVVVLNHIAKRLIAGSSNSGIIPSAIIASGLTAASITKIAGLITAFVFSSSFFLTALAIGGTFKLLKKAPEAIRTLATCIASVALAAFKAIKTGLNIAAAAISTVAIAAFKAIKEKGPKALKVLALGSIVTVEAAGALSVGLAVGLSTIVFNLLAAGFCKFAKIKQHSGTPKQYLKDTAFCTLRNLSNGVLKNASIVLENGSKTKFSDFKTFLGVSTEKTTSSTSNNDDYHNSYAQLSGDFGI